MQFKSLHIQGFKSFVDKTLIDFPKGITAIVGPNGSGKSNIMDALRWVFGEQRASELRGGDMEDVIFSGSDHRKPSGYAEVGLTLSDLSEELSAKWGSFSEITISRKIYRSGEREYFINARRCRLKDIKDIFFDTGLGAKSISIIEQERVTKIVNSSPEELRYFLEETAGVVRYKERKKEAETRLRQTEDNLSRINDLLSIVHADLEKLAAQAEQVKIYREYRKNRTDLEKAFLCSTYAKLVKDKENYKKTIDNLRKEMADIIGRNQIAINMETDRQKRQEELREEIKSLRDNYDRAKSSMVKAEGEIDKLNSNITEADSQKEQLRSDLDSYSKRLEELEDKLYELDDEIEEAVDLVDDFKEKAESGQNAVQELKAMHDAAAGKLKEINSLYLRISQKLTETSNDINIKKSAKASHESAMLRLRKELETLSMDSGDMQEKLERAVKEMENLQVQINYSERQKESAKIELADKEAGLESAKSSLSDNNIKIKTAENKISLLEKDINIRSSGGEAAKILEKFEAVPYTALNGCKEAYILYSGLLVVKDEYEKEAGIEAGKSDVTLRYILHKDIDKLTPAQQLTQIGENFYKQDNIFLRIGNDSEALIILELKEKLEEEYALIEVLNDTKEELSMEIDDLKAEIVDINSFYEKYVKETRLLETEFAAHQSTVKNITEHKERTFKHISVVQKEIELASELLDTTVAEIESLNSEKELIRRELDKIEEEREDIEEKAENINGELETVREKHSYFMREYTKYFERRSALEKERASLGKDKVLTLETINNLKKRISELEEIKVEEWKDLLKKAASDKEIFTLEVLNVKEKIITAEQEQQDIDNHLFELRENLSGLNREIHNIEIKIADMQSKTESADINMTALTEQMNEAYECNICEIWIEYAAKYPNKQQITESMEKIDKMVEELGPLNMAAESEYSEKKEDYDKHTAQRADIEEAALNLKNLIFEIDESTVKLFEETYTAVRQNFIDVFNRFFGSGSGDLTLTDPENMLTTGVEISINPPGKKVSHKNLLSGGEKALSALTLLFALFLQKPTPFCFLDEVDAPLDDANVGRFIAMVSSLSDQTQFVIITHKHQTMASAGSLYGVTMQEGGVSTLLSVELKKG